MKKFTAFIVDDELDNVEVLKHFVKQYCPSLNIIGEALTRSDAISFLKQNSPDILFLDIVLDIGTSFDILEEIQIEKTQVIFVTAYDEFAIKAFKYNAVDYVLKPIVITELISAVDRAKDRLEESEYFNKEQIKNLMDTLSSDDSKVNPKILAIPTIDNIEMVNVDDIYYCKSDGKYTEFYLAGKKKLVSSRNIGEYENLLDETLFFRIHKSYLVNLQALEKIDKAAGNYCILKDGTSLPIAKRRQDRLVRFLKLKS